MPVLQNVIFRSFIIAGLLLLSTSAFSLETTIEQKIEKLQMQIDELRAQLPAQKKSTSQEISRQPQVTFGGQYRINAYSADNDNADPDDQTASRVRIRQNLDFKFDEQFQTHLQFELGHTTGNIGTTGRGTINSDNPGTGEVRVRHAIMQYTTENKIILRAGILPLSDKFGDMLFSSDWDYNPVAVSANIPASKGNLRFAAGSVSEGTEGLQEDDIDHYQLDYELPMGDGDINVGISLIQMPDNPATPTDTFNHLNFGIGFKFPLGGMNLDGFLLGSSTDKELLGTVDDGSGVAAKLELSGTFDQGDVSVMATYAEGENNGSGFIPVMSLVGTNGYWGYMGLLTVQGPTDTGIDGDAVNFSNNGFGLTTIQAKYGFPVSPRIRAYLAAGWFGNTDATGRNDTVGTELIAIGTYRFNRVLALDFGAAAANLKDSVSGYSNGAAGAFNQPVGVNRNKNALFARLQAEF